LNEMWRHRYSKRRKIIGPPKKGTKKKNAEGETLTK